MTAEPKIEKARELVLEFGWNATCYQILNPGFELWFSDSGDAVVGYVQHVGHRLVGGAPVCDPDRLSDGAAAFEADARAEGLTTCYFGAESHLQSVYSDSSAHSMILLGSQPEWDPRGWQRRLSNHSSLRAQLNRARNKGVRAEPWSPSGARNHPELRRCLDEWLEGRGLPPLHFLVETDTLERTRDRKIVVASRGHRVVGFLVASPIPMRNGWLIEQIVRGHGAVNGTSEVLIDGALRSMIEDGNELVTLGLAPLSTHTGRTHHENPLWLRTLLNQMRAHGRRYYNFSGLEAFKAKFEPDRWDPVYAIVDEKSIGLRTLYAIAAAFAQGSPIGLMLRAVRRALRTEGRAVRERLSI